MHGRLTVFLNLLLFTPFPTSVRAAGGAGSDAHVLPEPAAILARMVERAREISRQTNGPAYVYEKRAVLDTLNSDGVVKRSKEKVYEVKLSRGMTQNRLIAVDGHPLALEDSATRSENERRLRNRYAVGPGSSSPDRMDDLMNERLIARFDFTMAGREVIRGRSCYVLTFVPKARELASERLIDRVINLLQGRVWIDEADFEITRAEVHTEGALRLWGGFLGALESLRLNLEREPGMPGVWFNRVAELNVCARRLFSPIRMRVREVASDFRRLEDEASVVGNATANGGNENRGIEQHDGKAAK